MNNAAAWPPAPGSTWRLPGHRIRQVTGYLADENEDIWGIRMRHPDGGEEEQITKIEWESWSVAPVPVLYDL